MQTLFRSAAVITLVLLALAASVFQPQRRSEAAISVALTFTNNTSQAHEYFWLTFNTDTSWLPGGGNRVGWDCYPVAGYLTTRFDCQADVGFGVSNDPSDNKLTLVFRNESGCVTAASVIDSGWGVRPSGHAPQVGTSAVCGPGSVGGIAESPDVTALPSAAASGRDYKSNIPGVIVLIAVAGVVVGGWYVRRKRAA